MKAMWPGVCWICESTWPQGADIAVVKGEYVHQSCAPGED